MQTVLVNIPFVDLEALVDSAIQIEGKINQANENRKRRMMRQNGPNNAQKYRPSPSGGFAPRPNKPFVMMPRPNFFSNDGMNPKPEVNNNSKTAPVTPRDNSTVTCFKCGIKGHYANECPQKVIKTAPATPTSAQQQRRIINGRNPNNRNGHLYRMTASEAPEAPNVVMGMFSG
jgi:hypothetical protein